MRFTDRRRIAVDCRLIGYTAGIARYASELTAALVHRHEPEEFIALAGRRGDPPPAASDGRYESIRLLTPPHHPRERSILPAEILFRTLPRWPGILHSVDHVAPSWGPWRSVVTVHDLAFLTHPETHSPASRRYYAAVGRSLEAASAVIAVSRFTADDLVRHLAISLQRIWVIHEAASGFFGPGETESPPSHRSKIPLILFVGTADPRKNLAVLLRAMAQVVRTHTCELAIAGTLGPMAEPLQQLAADLRLTAAVNFLGPQTEMELRGLYQAASIVALPSLSEGFGLTVLEAMACGTPVVCSAAGSLPEIAGDAAILVDPTSSAAWSQALGELLDNPTLRSSLIARGLKRAGEFSWQEAARETLAVYRSVLRE